MKTRKSNIHVNQMTSLDEDLLQCLTPTIKFQGKNFKNCSNTSFYSFYKIY